MALPMQTTHEVQGGFLETSVFFTGDTKVGKGRGVCYDRDRGTAAEPDQTRDTFVEQPTAANARRFAGVATRDYPAVSGGQYIKIWLPGGLCYMSIGQATVVNQTVLSAAVGTAQDGRFSREGPAGHRGCALALQTIAQSEFGHDAAVNDLGGSISASTLTDTDNFDNAEVGDVVVLVATGKAALNTLGEYTVTSVVTTNDGLVLDSAPGGTSELVSYYVLNPDGNILCLAYLYDGPESGLHETIAAVDNAAADVTATVGTTYLAAGITIGGGDTTGTLEDGTEIGQRFRFVENGALTSASYVLTITNGTKIAGVIKESVTVTAESDLDEFDYEWMGTSWKHRSMAGAVET